MGLLFRIALRLAPLRKLKARRTELLLEKSWLLEATRQAQSEPIDLVLDLADRIYRVNEQLDAINNEIGRRGGL